MYITRCNILEMPRNSLFQYAIQKVKCYILNIFYNSNKNWSEIGNFQKAIFLGDSSSISKDTLNRFKNSGTLHLFAVSGLHVGLLYIILNFSISFLSKKRFFNEILVVFILFVYLNIVEFPPSAVRAFLMVACWQLSKVFFKKSNALSSLFLSAVFVLFLNPYLIMTIGFQLSYTVVLSILVIHLLTTKHIQVQKRNVNLIISYFLTSYAAFCGSTLLVFDNFQLIVPGAILINIIIIPFIFLSQIFIFTNLIISFFFDFSLINYIIEFLYKILLFVLDKFTLENITFIKFDNKLGVNNVVHLIYPFLFFLFFYKKTFLFFNLFLYIVIPLLLIFIF